jgi:ribonuclease P protein component
VSAGLSEPGATSRQRFPKRVRLLRASEFKRVFDTRSSASDASIVLYGAVSETGHPRIGLTVSRRIGGAAERNRWKRLLREAFRLTQAELPPLDLVCVVRAESPPALEQIREALIALSARVQNRIDERAKRGGRSSS